MARKPKIKAPLMKTKPLGSVSVGVEVASVGKLLLEPSKGTKPMRGGVVDRS